MIAQSGLRECKCVVLVYCYTVPTELSGVMLSYSAYVWMCMYVHLSVRHEMSPNRNDWTEKRQFGAHVHACWRCKSANRFSSKWSTVLTFIFKFKHSNRVHQESLYVNILSEAVKDSANITIAFRYEIAHGLSIRYVKIRQTRTPRCKHLSVSTVT